METKQNEAVKEAFKKRKATETLKADTAAGKKDVSEVLPMYEERFTKAKIAAWRKEYEPRQLILLGAEGKLAVLRPPVADDLSEYMTAIGMNGMSKAVSYILDTLWIDGDAELILDDDLFNAIFLQINNILEGKKADYFRL